MKDYLGASDLAEALRCSRASATRYLLQLEREHGESYVVRRGPGGRNRALRRSVLPQVRSRYGSVDSDLSRLSEAVDSIEALRSKLPNVLTSLAELRSRVASLESRVAHLSQAGERNR